jgi:hypothetical protein
MTVVRSGITLRLEAARKYLNDLRNDLAKEMQSPGRDEFKAIIKRDIEELERAERQLLETLSTGQASCYATQASLCSTPDPLFPIATVVRGERVTLLAADIKRYWYRVRTNNGIEGWMMRKVLTPPFPVRLSDKPSKFEGMPPEPDSGHGGGRA